jgi:lysozyme
MSKLLDLIKEHEGVVPHAYTDSRGYLTIGVGRLIDEKLGGKLSDDEIDYLLTNDLNRCLEEAATYPWYEAMNEVRQAVIISMLFNLGKPNFDKFQNMQAALLVGDHALASREMLDSRWANQVGKRANELSEMMESGEWHDG